MFNKRNKSRRGRTVGGFAQIPYSHKSDWEQVVFTYGDQTIAGVKTFTSFPVGPSAAPTTDYQFANKKYVDDQLSVVNLWDRHATGYIYPHNANDDIYPNTSGSIGAATSRWSNAYINHIFMLPTATAITVDGTGLGANHFLNFSNFDITTGSFVNFGSITTKTSGYLFNGEMATSILDDSLLLNDFTVSCNHDGLGADTLRMIRRTWSGSMPNDSFNSDFAIFEGVLRGVVGSGGAEGGQVKGLHLDWTGATLQGSDIDAYPIFVDARGITIDDGHGTAYNEFGLARWVDDKSDTIIGVSDVAGENAIRTNGEINDRDYFSFFEDFCMQTINETDFGIVLHSNGGGLDPFIIPNREGGQIDLVTGGTTDDGSELQVAIPVRAVSGKLVMEGRIKPSFDITDMKIFIGLTDNVNTFEHPFDIDGSDVVTAIADNACGFVYDTTAATDEWFMASVNTTTVDTGSAALGIAPSNDTYQKFRIEISSNGVIIKFYIDDVLIGTLNTGIGVSSTIFLYPTIIISELNNSARTLVADYIYSGHTR